MELSYTDVVSKIVIVAEFIISLDWAIIASSLRVWKTGPALATGCTIVMKPSEITPLTALVSTCYIHCIISLYRFSNFQKLCELIKEAGYGIISKHACIVDVSRSLDSRQV